MTTDRFPEDRRPDRSSGPVKTLAIVAATLVGVLLLAGAYDAMMDDLMRFNLASPDIESFH